MLSTQVIASEALGTDDQYAVLRHVLDRGGPDRRVLDIGAGPGANAYIDIVRPLAAHLVGVDPDPRVLANPNLDEAYEGTVEDHAAALRGRFDLAVAIYVVEHVEHPDAFMGAIASALRPGGSFVFITPSIWHYFGATTWLAGKLGLEDRLLGRLRGEVVEHYHFETRYLMNSVRAITRTAERVGFSKVEVTHLDDPGVFEPYAPARLRWAPRAYSNAVHRYSLKGAMGTLLVECTR